MRLAIAIIVVIMSLSVCVHAQDRQAGPVLHYSFDDVTNATVADQSGHGNDGRLMGSARRVTGRFGSALELNGRDGYIDCGAGADLDIGKTGGTVMFWFRPQGTCQGGLVGWTAGSQDRPSDSNAAPAAPVNEDQRLMVSLYSKVETRSDGTQLREALGLYIADGKHFDAPFRSNFHKPYFPSKGRWLFYAVTFNGRAIEIYRDGVHVMTRFQTLVPDTAGVPMFIGRCFGMSGPSDYFRGQIDEVSVYNRPLSSLEIYDRYMQTVAHRGKQTDHFGGVGIEAKAYPKPGIIFADLDYRNLLVMPEDVGLTATLHDAAGVTVAAGRIHMLPAWGRAEVRVDVAHLPAGAYELRVSTACGEPRAATVQWPGRAEGWEHVRALNNFCWDLLNQSQNPQTEYVFTNPRRGWVYIVTEADGDLTLNLPQATPSTVRFADDGAKQEVMRWMEPGTYRITTSGDGSLKQWSVRAVPILAFHHYPHVGPGAGNDHDYLIEHVLDSYNTVITHDYNGTPYEQFRQMWAERLGRHVLDTSYPAVEFEWNAKLKEDTARQQILDYLTPYPGLNKSEYQGVILDEFTAGNDQMLWNKSFYDEWIETLAAILEDPKYAGRHISPFMGYNMYDYEKSSAFLRMFIEHKSPVYEEWYLDERETEEQAWLYINESAAAIAPLWEESIPGYTESALKLLSYLQRECWNPAVDFKAHLQLQFEHFATRPEFFGLGGIGAYASYRVNHEEYVRWVSQLSRHYGLEGHMDRLHDYPYAVDHIDNPDFINGTDGWTLEPASGDSMARKQSDRYGRLQERYPYRNWTDTPFLWTKRSAQKPNVFSQQIRHLTPGQLYVARVWVGDYSEFIAGASKDKPRAISLDINGAEIWDGWYRTQSFETGDGNSYNFGSYEAPPFGGGNLYYFSLHQRIFRATSETAQLTITDWQNADEPGGPAGQELMFNFIEVRPYLDRVAGPIGERPEMPTMPAASETSGITRIFLCAGQSNMVGMISPDALTGEYAEAPANAIYWSWAKNSWIDFPDRTSDHDRIGPEIPFAHRLAKAFPNDTIAIVKLSVGGITMEGQWKPGSGDLYVRLIANARAAIESLKSRGDACEVAGMIWLQGESDAQEGAQVAAEAYEANLSKLIELVRRDLDAPALAVVVGRISDGLSLATRFRFPNVKLVQHAQEQVARNDANVYLITIDDIPNDDDHIHFLPEGYFEIGNRFADAMIGALSGATAQ